MDRMGLMIKWIQTIETYLVAAGEVYTATAWLPTVRADVAVETTEIIEAAVMIVDVATDNTPNPQSLCPRAS
jgi:hypothetical protein